MEDEFTVMTILGNSEMNTFTNTDEDKHQDGMRRSEIPPQAG